MLYNRRCKNKNTGSPSTHPQSCRPSGRLFYRKVLTKRKAFSIIEVSLSTVKRKTFMAKGENELQKQMMSVYVQGKLQDLVRDAEANNEQWARGLSYQDILHIIAVEVTNLPIKKNDDAS